MTHNSLLQRYFQLNSAYSFHALFYRQNNNLTEEPSLANDSFYTGYRKNGTTYVYYVDDNICDNQEVTGGSYASVKYFANSETHEVHHLIPAKLLKMTGICKLSSSEISFSFFDRSVFYFEQIIWSTSFRSLILLLLTPPGAPSNSSFFTLIQTSILKNSQPEPTDFLWLMTLFNIYSAKEF